MRDAPPGVVVLEQLRLGGWRLYAGTVAVSRARVVVVPAASPGGGCFRRPGVREL
jgi:hypothetical protein